MSEGKREGVIEKERVRKKERERGKKKESEGNKYFVRYHKHLG